MKRRTAVCVVALLVPLVAAPGVGAATKRTIKAEADGLTLAGQIKSNKKPCIKNQFVAMMRKQQGQDMQVESMTSNRNGKFQSTQAFAGKFYAEVTKNPDEGCSAAKSNVVTLPEKT